MRTMERTDESNGDARKRGARGAAALFALLLALLLAPAFASLALAIGASPATLSFEHVLPGGYAETSILLSNPRDGPVAVSPVLVGDGAEWCNVSPANLTLPGRGSARVTVAVSPPMDAEPRSYGLSLELASSPTGASAAGTPTSRLALTLSVPVDLVVESDARPACVLGGFTVPDYERGMQLFARYAVRDTGNTRITPQGELTVRDAASGSMVASQDVAAQAATLPTRTGEYTMMGATGLEEGSYEATLAIDGCGAPRRAAFAVLPPGALSDQGDFTGLDANATGAPGAILPVQASFRNSGERPFAVRFSGVVEKDDKVVRVLETEPLLAAPGESVSLESFFTPPGPGNYTIRGSLVYGGRRTGERSVTLVVPATAPVSAADGGVALATFFLILVLLAVFLLVLIHRKRRGRQS